MEPVRNLAISKKVLYRRIVLSPIPFLKERIKFGRQAAMFVKNISAVIVPMRSSPTTRHEAINCFFPGATAVSEI